MKERLLDFFIYALLAVVMISTVAGMVIQAYLFVMR